MLDPDDPNVRRAVFGKQVEDFIASDIGVYLTQRVSSEIEAATEKLKKVDPNDAKAVQALQNQIFRVESLMDWLADVITAGHESMRILQED